MADQPSWFKGVRVKPGPFVLEGHTGEVLTGAVMSAYVENDLRLKLQCDSVLPLSVLSAGAGLRR